MATPDLADETLLASQLPEDEWLRLARDFGDAANHRLALRAFYLSILAGLGERGLLAIARHKSNRDYLLELRRRARDRDGLQGASRATWGGSSASGTASTRPTKRCWPLSRPTVNWCSGRRIVGGRSPSDLFPLPFS